MGPTQLDVTTIAEENHVTNATAGASSARQVASRYIALVSAGDLDGLVALFRPDATLLHPLGQFAGRDAIRSFYADNILPRGLRLTAVSFVADERCCVFELAAHTSTDVTHAIDHLTVDADGRVERLAIYYR